MRSQLFVFGLTLLAYFPCYAQEIIVASVGGASDREIHDVVVEEARASGYELTLNNNYVKHNAATIAVGWPHRIAMFKDKIMRAAALRNEDRSNISLVLIGKSAGAMQIWAALDRYYDEFDDFRRIAIVLIDPHGAVIGDGEVGRRDSDDPLWWPGRWSSDIDFLRVYHIYQRNFPGAGGGLTGAPFPDKRVCRSRELTNNSINHTNIPMQPESRRMIQDAFLFASQSRVGIKPHDITLLNARGRDTVDGERNIAFRVESSDSACYCYDARIQIFQNSVLRTTLSNIEEGEEEEYRPIRGRNVLFKTSCRRKVVDKQVNLDFEPPTFDNIVVSPNTRRERSMILHANRVEDDGYWNTSDYRVQVTLDGTHNYSGSGTGITIDDLSDGNHSATMRISDGLGRWSDSKTTTFFMGTARPVGRFITPVSNIPISRGSNLTIVFLAGHPSGIMRVSIYLDRISEDEFDFTKICTIPGDFGVGQPEQRACPLVPTVSSGSLDWRPGPHRLIAVIKDNSGNETTVETVVQIR